MNTCSSIEEIRYELIEKQGFFDNTIFDFDILLKDVYGDKKEINEQIQFSNCIFKESVNFSGYTFKEASCFKGSTFEKFVSFEDTTFEKSLDLSEVTFNDIANFYLLKSNINTSFIKAKFYSDTFFYSAKLLNIANFSKVSFGKENQKKYVNFNNSEFGQVNIINSIFNSKVSFNNTIFNGNTVFNKSIFKNSPSFDYTVFNKLVDFSSTTFKKPQIFYRTNFNSNVFFYDSSLKEIDLHKTIIEKNIYFLGANIEKTNRETYRIIKHQYEKLNNRIESLKYHSLEMREYKKELFGDTSIKANTFSLFFKELRNLFYILKKGNRKDKLILFFNQISNNHNTNPIRGLGFTLSIALIFYFGAMYFTNNNHFSFNNINSFLIFINPTHKIGDIYVLNPTKGFYIMDFLGRIFISYGIYQFIQAFRKFGKK